MFLTSIERTNKCLSFSMISFMFRLHCMRGIAASCVCRTTLGEADLDQLVLERGAISRPPVEEFPGLFIAENGHALAFMRRVSFRSLNVVT
jgi:hypothetical protein